MNPILCIDPGASGGFALVCNDGTVEAYPMPEGMTGQIDAIHHIAATNPGLTAIIENVGFHRPGNSAVASCKFARHVGHLEAALYACGIPTTTVTPSKWVAALGSLPAEKRDRKNAIKEKVARQFPHLKVTLGTADALGILVWARTKTV